MTISGISGVSVSVVSIGIGFSVGLGVGLGVPLDNVDGATRVGVVAGSLSNNRSVSVSGQGGGVGQGGVGEGVSVGGGDGVMDGGGLHHGGGLDHALDDGGASDGGDDSGVVSGVRQAVAVGVGVVVVGVVEKGRVSLSISISSRRSVGRSEQTDLQKDMFMNHKIQNKKFYIIFGRNNLKDLVKALKAFFVL